MTNLQRIKLNKLDYAIDDIQQTLKIWRDGKGMEDPYIQKLYKEFDEKTVTRQKLVKKINGKKTLTLMS